VWGTLQNEPESARRFVRLLGEIHALLFDTHQMVIARLGRVIAAHDTPSARAAIESLRGAPLEGAFRAEGLCDAFGAFGTALDGVLNHAQGQADSTLAQDTLSQGRPMAAMLIMREGEVAYGYTTSILDLLRKFGATDPAGDLEPMKRGAQAAHDELTRQLLAFQTNAERFRRWRRDNTH
jgi:hypothetical protein